MARPRAGKSLHRRSSGGGGGRGRCGSRRPRQEPPRDRPVRQDVKAGEQRQGGDRPRPAVGAERDRGEARRRPDPHQRPGRRVGGPAAVSGLPGEAPLQRAVDEHVQMQPVRAVDLAALAKLPGHRGCCHPLSTSPGRGGEVRPADSRPLSGRDAEPLPGPPLSLDEARG